VRWSNTVGCSQNCCSSSMSAFCNSSSVVKTTLESFLRRCRKTCSAGLPFRTIRGQIERMHALRPTHFTTAMAARTVQNHPDGTLSQLVAQMLQEELQAWAFHGRQQEKDTRPRGRFDRGIQPEPLVVVLHNPRGTFPQRTPAPPQPGDQAKAACIQGHDSFERWSLDEGSAVF
jgi:hypothetical protein